MWVRKTAEEINTSPPKDDRNRFDASIPMLAAAFTTGIAIVFASPTLSAVIYLFSAVFLISGYLQAFLQDIFLSDGKSRGDDPDPDSNLFCPDCRLLQAHAALCPVCRGPLEPMAHWKWEEATNPRTTSTAHAPPTLVATGATSYENAPALTRQISISLPIPRRKLAAQIGIGHSRLLKDLLDQNLFAAINPRLADREALTNLGRKYRIAFRFVD